MLSAPHSVAEALSRFPAPVKTPSPLTPLGTLSEWISVRKALAACGRTV